MNTKERKVRMKVSVAYEAQVTHLPYPIFMAGIFNSTEHFKMFAKEEVKRGCYKHVPFVVKEEKLISEEEYQGYLNLLYEKGA